MEDGDKKMKTEQYQMSPTEMVEAREFMSSYGTNLATIRRLRADGLSMDDVGSLLEAREGLYVAFSQADPASLTDHSLVRVKHPSISLMALQRYHRALNNGSAVDGIQIAEDLCEAHRRFRSKKVYETIARAIELAELKGPEGFRAWLRGTSEMDYEAEDELDEKVYRLLKEENNGDDTRIGKIAGVWVKPLKEEEKWK